VQFLYVFLDAREHPTEKFDDRKIESPGGEPAFFVLNLSVLKSFGQISRSPGPPTIQLAPHEMAGVALFLDAREHPTEKFDDRKIESPGSELLSALNFSVSQILRSDSASLMQFHAGVVWESFCETHRILEASSRQEPVDRGGSGM